MVEKTGSDRKTIITEIKQKIRLLNMIAAFIVITLLAVILRYLYKPVSEAMDFLPDISITLIIAIVTVLAIASFYMWGVVSRRIIRSIEKYRNRLDHMLTVTKDLREEIHADVVLDKIMGYSLSITQSDAGSIFLIEGDNLVFKVVKGNKAAELSGTAIPKGKGIAGWVAENAQPLLVADTKSDERFNADVDTVTGYETRSVLCVPLLMKKEVIGVIELLNKKEGFYSEKDKELITYLSDQAAISLTRARFYEDQKNYEIHITDILLEAIDVQIPEKLGHSKRVAKYSNIIAKAINMPGEKTKRLYFACLLHDVGFLKIMADENYQSENFRKHPAIGYEMISPINFYADIAPFILHHHERYDGFGYPEGLKADEIPLESRIIAVAEAFDAMVSETSYKVPLDFDSAVLELQRNAGSQFDFWLVEVFVNNITTEHLQ
jgi:putative methionine-R-sulfoxide reductase with GAF domain